MKKIISAEEQQSLLDVLKTRFEKNTERHKNLAWERVEEKLLQNPEKLWSISEMEKSGGEPDVVVFDDKSEDIIFVDCSPETPKNRRSFCFDREALDKRKEHKPANSAMDSAKIMEIELLNETQYRKLQELGKFDLKTSSWIATPEKIRKLGGALFCDRRYDTVFVYHNGADSYYASRAFRGMLKI